MTLPFALTASPNVSYAWPDANVRAAPAALRAVPLAHAGSNLNNSRSYRYTRHAETPAAKPAPDVLRPRRGTATAQRGEAGPRQKIFDDVAEKIGMSPQALRRDPAQGLARLFRRFGPSVPRTELMPTLSVHAIQISRHEFAAWREVFGIAAATDETKQKDALPNLLEAVQDFAVGLLQSRHGGRKAFQDMWRGNFIKGLRQGSQVIALTGAIAEGLRKVGPGDALGEAEAYWFAKLILCKYEPSLGRMDAPDTLVFGSPRQLHRELAILARTAGHASHWTLSESWLLKDPPPPNASREAFRFAALKFAYAQHRDYLPPLPEDRRVDVDPVILDHAVEDLRRSLYGAGIADRLLPPGPEGLDALPPDWIDRIDWTAFDGPDFLLSHGAEAPYRNTLAWWMRAIRDALQLEATFDVAGMDSGKRKLFVARVAASQAFGANPDDDWDTGFVQSLFTAFLRHYIAPLAAAPFERALWRATGPLHLLQCSDPAVSPGLPRVLRSIDEVKEDLRRELFSGGPWRGSKEQQWAVRFLCGIYAPALAIAGLPGQMAYGGADYIAMELLSLYPGLPRGNLTMETARQLLDQDSLVELMRPLDTEESNPPLKASPLPAIVKRIAHAHGVIDAGRQPISRSDWEKALRHFEKLTLAASEQGDALARGMGTIIGRTQSIQNLLREMGCDPLQEFTMPFSAFPYLNLWIREPLAFGEPHTLAKIVREEALSQVLAYGDLSGSQAAMLKSIRDRWPKETLLRRCREDFDRSFKALIESEVMPAMERLVQALPADEQRFWQCGNWTIRLPRATLEVERRYGAIPDRRRRPSENVLASGAVLVDLTLENETRHYWVSFRPAGLARYTGSVAELIREHLPIFFRASDLPGRRIAGFVAIRHLYPIRADGGQNVLRALVAQAFPKREVDRLYQEAIGETDTERADAPVRDFILQMVPGYACGKAVTTPERLQTAFIDCALDAAGVLPLLKIGGKAFAKFVGIAQRAIAAEMMAAPLSAMTGRRALHAVFLDGYPIVAGATRNGLGYLDPGLGSTVMFWRVGKGGLTLLRNKFGHIGALHDWRTRIDKMIRLRDDVFPEYGLWRTRPKNPQIDAAGNADFRIGHARYEVADLGDIADVLVMPAGAGRVRPVNPETGLPCGFAQRRTGMVRVHRPPGRSQIPAAMLRHCRQKRTLPVSFSSCSMMPAPHIGADYYSMPDTGDWPLYQKVSNGREALRAIDPSSIAYRSYTGAGEKLSESDMFFHDGILYRRLNNGHLLGVDWGLEMDQTIYGSFSYEKFIPGNGNGNAGGRTWYVRSKIDIDRTAQGEGKISMVCVAPYGDFTDADGAPLRMVTLFGQPYVFKGGELLRRNHKFKLRKAAPAQISLHGAYGKINSYDYPGEIKKTILRLSDEPRYRSAIDTTLQRFDEMLENAKLYYSSTDSNRFLRKFVQGEDIDLAENFRQRLLGQLGQIEDAIPYLKAHKDQLIAVADLKASGESLAVSLNRAMEYPLDPGLLNKPVLIIDQTELAIRPANVAAAYLGHELTHTVLGTLDTMVPGSNVQFYASLKRNGDVDISMLRFGARTPGLDPSICASVLEHCLSVGDGMARGDVRVRDVVDGESSIYNRDGDAGAVRKRRGMESLSKPFWSEEQLSDVDVMSYILISAFPPGRGNDARSRPPRSSVFHPVARARSMWGESVSAAPPPAAGPYSADGSLREDWLERLPLQAFDDIAFFREFDIAIANPLSFMQRLDAAYRCFRPAMSDSQAPLALDDMNQPRLRAFFRRLLPALGLGNIPVERLAPQFKEYLFQRWFLSLASPPSADGNGGPRAFPLQDMFLAAIHNKPALAKGCEGRPDQPRLMRIDYLRDNVAAQFRRENADIGRDAEKWILDGLLSIFEPTLLRRDLPPKLRYGAIEWTLLDMGLRMAGPYALGYSHAQLVGLAGAADIVDDNGRPGLAGAFVGSALRMAHAHGAIDLRGGGDLEEALETAIALFQREIDALRQANSMEALLARLPTRGSIVAAELRKRGLDPQELYWLRKPGGYGRDLLESRRKMAPGLAFDAPHSLADFVMAGCVPQLYEFGNLKDGALGNLERALRGLTHAGLDAMFAAQFNAAFNTFSDDVLARFLDEKIGVLDISDLRFWQCGQATVRVPQAGIVARIASKPERGAIGAGSKTTINVGRHEATRGVLVALTLDERGRPPETRHYWVTQAPLAAGRFDGDVGALLAGRLNDFFEPKEGEEALITLAPDADIWFETAAGAASLTAQQLVARQLLAPQRPKLREKAFQMTGPELRLEEMTQSMLDLLPFRACVRARNEGNHYEAALFCMADAVSLIPMIRVGGLTFGNAAKVAASRSGPQLKRFAQTLAAGAVERGLAYAEVRDVLHIGRPMLLTVKEAARFMNPLDPLWAGLGWIKQNGKPMGAALLRQLRKTSAFGNLARHLEREMTLPCIFKNGFWRAAADAPVIREGGRRQLRIAGRAYALEDSGAQHGVLTLSQDGQRHLADPLSGGLLAPISRPETALQYRMQRWTLRREPCRSKRGDAEEACWNLIEPAARFGAGFQRVATEKRFEGMQMTVRELDGGRKSYLRTRVDLNDLAFFSYTKMRGKTYGPLNRYFTFEKRIWIAENGRLLLTTTDCPYPERIEATVVRIGAAGAGRDGANYLRFDIALPRIPGDERRFHQTFIAPYGSYPGLNGECMGILDFPDASYTFKHSWISELRAGEKVVLKLLPANAPDMKLFEQYRRINLNVRMQPDVFEDGSTFQLRMAGSVMQQRFDQVCRRAEKMLHGAHKALRNPGLGVQRLLERILPQRWNQRRRRVFLDVIENNVEDMIAAMDIVKRNKYEVIGFGFANREYTGAGPMQWALPYARAEALSASMMGEMHDFPLVTQALIHFDVLHFQTARMEALAMDLVHELSHARFDSLDTMRAESTVPVYPRISALDRNLLDIQPLLDAWAESGSNVPMHASSNEILVKLLSSAVDPAQRDRLDAIMAGGSTFPLPPDAPEPGCLDGCVLLR